MRQICVGLPVMLVLFFATLKVQLAQPSVPVVDCARHCAQSLLVNDQPAAGVGCGFRQSGSLSSCSQVIHTPSGCCWVVRKRWKPTRPSSTGLVETPWMIASLV